MKSLVIIPTYNERENLERLTAMIFQVVPEAHVLIVDDNSPDGTGRLADRLAQGRSRLHVLHRTAKQGLGTAYLEGFRYALERDYEVVFEMDADLSHDPKYLPDFFEALDGADVVIGSRYLTGVNVINWPMRRLLLSYGANLYARLITGLPVRDLTSGYKCFRREVLEAVDLDRVHSEGYAFQIEMNFLARRGGFRLKEVPIVFVDRRAGATKMSRKIILEAVWRVWLLRLAGLRRSMRSR